MSLTKEDLVSIREIVNDVFDRRLEPIYEELGLIKGGLSALRNDVKEIYDMIADINRRIDQKSIIDPAFSELSDTEQLLRLNDMLLLTAKRLGVDLPR